MGSIGHFFDDTCNRKRFVPAFNFDDFPNGSSLPKYFLAVSFVITTDCGWDNAVFGFPSMIGKVKTSKKLEST